MELRAGYRHSEIGMIPEDWDVETVGELAVITTGAKNTQDREKNGLYPFFVRSQTVERINSWSFDGEAVLTAGDGVGTGKVFHYINGKFDVHQRVYRISNFSPRLVGYFFFLYFSNHFYCRIMQMTAKSSVDSVRKEMISGMQVPVPRTTTEQSAIATALSDVDGLLATLDALIAKKRAIKQGAMRELLTGKRRLPGFDEEWEVRRLGDHLEFLSNGVNSRAELMGEGRVRYLHYGDIHGTDCVLLNPATAAMPCLPEAKARRLDRLRDGDLVFADASEDLYGVGKSVELQGVGEIEVVSGMHTIAVRFDKAILADGFKGYLQFVPSFQDHLHRLASGTKVLATNMSHIASAEVKLPSAKEQVAITEIFTDMDAELSALEIRRSKTAQLKQGMMQELLTGRIRLV